MQRFAVALAAAVCAVACSQASASVYAPGQCEVFDHIPNELVRCSGQHPVSACYGPGGCTSITDSKDCMSSICCCSRAPTTKLTARRMIETGPAAGAPAPGPAQGPAAGPMPMPMPMPMPAEPPAPCLANITYGYPWEENGEWLNSLNIQLSNSGPAPINIPYTVTISKAGWAEVIQAWNWEASVDERNFVTGNFTYGAWQDLQPNDESSSWFGFIVQSTENGFTPQDLTLNGVNCKIVA